jgi:hypothetical protein
MASRTFRIPDGPSVSDPAHIIAVYETFEDRGINPPLKYTDFTEVKEYIHKLELKDSYNSGYAAAERKVWKDLKISNTWEYAELVKTRKNNG